MDIPLFSLQPEKNGLLLSDDKVDGIGVKLSWGERYGTAASLQDRKEEVAQPPHLYDPVLGRIEATVNDDPKNLIVDVMEENYYFFLAHHIRELICLCYRADDASRATLISGTATAVPDINVALDASSAL